MSPVSPRCPVCGHWNPAGSSSCQVCGLAFSYDPIGLDALDPVSRAEITAWEFKEWSCYPLPAWVPNWPYWPDTGGLGEPAGQDLGIDPGGW